MLLWSQAFYFYFYQFLFFGEQDFFLSSLKFYNQNKTVCISSYPAVVKTWRKSKQAERLESLFHRPGLKSWMRSSSSTWKARGRAGASAKGRGLKESQPALLCFLIPGVRGGAPLLPNPGAKTTHSAQQSVAPLPCPGEITSCFGPLLII